MNAKPLRRSFYSTPSPRRKIWEGRNINRLSFAYGVRHSLRAASPSVDHRCGGNLGFSEILVFTGFVITRANILSSLHSIRPHGSDFVAQGMLSYHALRESRNASASSVPCLSPDKFSAPVSSNSELLHTL